MRGVARDRGSVCQPRGAGGGHRSRGHERSAAARGETAGPGYAGIHPASGWLSGARPGRCRWHRPAGPAPGPAAVRSSAGGQGGDAPRVRPRRKGRPAQLASKAAWFQSHLATSVNPCPGLACPVWIPLVFRPGGYDRPVIRTDSSVYRPTHGRPSSPMGTPIPDFFRTPGTSLMSRLTCGSCREENRRSRNQCPLEEFAMYAVSAYIAYLFISISVTIWVARRFPEMGRVFLIDTSRTTSHWPMRSTTCRCGVLPDQRRLRSLALRYGAWPTDPAGTIESMSTKVGLVLLVLGGMHFFNLYVFSKCAGKRCCATRSPRYPPSSS